MNYGANWARVKSTRLSSKCPGSLGSALAHPAGNMGDNLYPPFSGFRFRPALVRYDGLLLFTVGGPNNVLSSRFIQGWVWARGVRCQQPNSTCLIGDAHEMDFLSPVLALSCNQISFQISGFVIY